MPHGPLLKNDGPACRVCGCTEHNACVIVDAETPLTVRIAKAVRMPAVNMPRLLTCSWVRVHDDTRMPLCSACEGTGEDMAHALAWMSRLLSDSRITDARVIGDAAILRWNLRKATSNAGS